MNIYSGETGLGAALTNPTRVAQRKGAVRKAYPVVFRGRQWPDAEAAYQHFKTGVTNHDDMLMAAVIAHKLRQHPELLDAVRKRGGVRFIRGCTHYTGALTPRGRAWEGAGVGSRFIRNLAAGVRLALDERPLDPHNPQTALF